MTIVVGYTATHRGQRALAAAKEHARTRKVPLHLVRYVAHEAGDSPTKVRADLEASRAAEASLEEVAAQLRAEGLSVTTAVRHGLYAGAAEALVSEAGQHDADLLVIGIRRRSPVGKIVLGSVAQDVLMRAPCAVLAVKGE